MTEGHRVSLVCGMSMWDLGPSHLQVREIRRESIKSSHASYLRASGAVDRSTSNLNHQPNPELTIASHATIRRPGRQVAPSIGQPHAAIIMVAVADGEASGAATSAASSCASWMEAAAGGAPPPGRPADPPPPPPPSGAAAGAFASASSAAVSTAELQLQQQAFGSNRSASGLNQRVPIKRTNSIGMDEAFVLHPASLQVPLHIWEHVGGHFSLHHLPTLGKGEGVSEALRVGKRLRRLIHVPGLPVRRTGNWQFMKQHLLADLCAGLTCAVMLIPQGTYVR